MTEQVTFWVPWIIVLLNAGVIVWFGKQKDEARNAQIETLKQQLEQQKDLAPDELRKHYTAMREMFEEMNTQLEEEKEELKKEIDEKVESLKGLKRQLDEANKQIEGSEAAAKAYKSVADVVMKVSDSLMETVKKEEVNRQRIQGFMKEFEKNFSVRAWNDYKINETMSERKRKSTSRSYSSYTDQTPRTNFPSTDEDK